MTDAALFAGLTKCRFRILSFLSNITHEEEVNVNNDPRETVQKKRRVHQDPIGKCIVII